MFSDCIQQGVTGLKEILVTTSYGVGYDSWLRVIEIQSNSINSYTVRFLQNTVLYNVLKPVSSEP